MYCMLFPDVDDCLYNPCMNGGTCIDNPGSYTCRCPSGWTGVNCTVGKTFNWLHGWYFLGFLVSADCFQNYLF